MMNCIQMIQTDEHLLIEIPIIISIILSGDLHTFSL